MPRFTFGELMQAVTLFGAVCYGAGWVFASSLYGRISVQPEAAGISATYLFVRATVLIGVLAAFGALLALLAGARGMLSRGREGNLRRFHILVLGNTLVFFAILAGSMAVLLRYGPHLPPWLSLVLGVAVALVGTMVEFAASIIAVGYNRRSGFGAALGPLRLPWALAAILAWLLVLLPVAGAAGVATGNTVRRGTPISNPFVSIHAVDVTFSLGMPENVRKLAGAAATLCALELGDNDGDILLYQATSKTLLAVSSQSVTILRRKNRC